LRKIAFAVMVGMLIVLAAGGLNSETRARVQMARSPATYRQSAESAWTLTWSDEFDGRDGSAPDPAKWVYDIGTGTNGWGNRELEYYTQRTENVVTRNGTLVITALKETFTDPQGATHEYTSARLKTKNLFSQAYGRFEARMKIPTGSGIWPAFWLLGSDIGAAGWPKCGEIDIMENNGKDPSTIHGTIHGPGYSGNKGIGSSYSLPAGSFSDDYHVFAVEWEPSAIRFYVDANLYATRTPAELPESTTWVFDHPFFLILNVAVGGNWPGPPNASTTFPQTMLVDYVRVYDRKSTGQGK
jgi:beta-glucanase (GH16 family)